MKSITCLNLFKWERKVVSRYHLLTFDMHKIAMHFIRNPFLHKVFIFGMNRYVIKRALA